MRRVLFLISHRCSGSDVLYRSLERHPKIQGYRGGNVYEGVHSLISLTSREHKLGNAAAIYMDELLDNAAISTRDLGGVPRCVFMVRGAEGTLGDMVALGYGPLQAARCYLFRLRRMYALACRARGSVLLTYSDISDGRCGLISSLLRLGPLEIDPVPAAPDVRLPRGLLEEATAGFEHWLHRLKSLGLACATTERQEGRTAVPGVEGDLPRVEGFPGE